MKKTTTAVSLVPKSQKEVPAVIKQLEEQLKALKGNIKDNISLDIAYQNGVNIKNVSSVKELLEISASIKARAEAYNREVKIHGLEGKVAEFSVSDKPVSDWELIIHKAVTELINKTQIDKLESAIKKLKSHLDADTRLQNELKEIMEDAHQPLK